MMMGSCNYKFGGYCSNYLFRKNFYKILNLVKLGGHLIYETFAQGNQIYGRPKNPNFLLKK